VLLACHGRFEAQAPSAIAATMLAYPVHRQMLPEIPSPIIAAFSSGPLALSTPMATMSHRHALSRAASPESDHRRQTDALRAGRPRDDTAALPFRETCWASE
jgi:hypothetical protein